MVARACQLEVAVSTLSVEAVPAEQAVRFRSAARMARLVVRQRWPLVRQVAALLVTSLSQAVVLLVVLLALCRSRSARAEQASVVALALSQVLLLALVDPCQ